jgi:hypothetical protein
MEGRVDYVVFKLLLLFFFELVYFAE